MVQGQKPLEILVIDDDGSIRILLQRFIEVTGEKADTAADGQEGIEKYVARYEAGYPYDAVLTDLGMPKANGADVTRKIKELSPATYVCVITARERTEEYKRMEAELGSLKPDGILQKPFSRETIMDLIDQIRLKISGTENPSNYK